MMMMMLMAFAPADATAGGRVSANPFDSFSGRLALALALAFVPGSCSWLADLRYQTSWRPLRRAALWCKTHKTPGPACIPKTVSDTIYKSDRIQYLNRGPGRSACFLLGSVVCLPLALPADLWFACCSARKELPAKRHSATAHPPVPAPPLTPRSTMLQQRIHPSISLGPWFPSKPRSQTIYASKNGCTRC